MGSSGNRLISSLCYKDAPAAIAWLEKAFGITPHMVIPGEEGEVMHSQIKTADGKQMLKSLCRQLHKITAVAATPAVTRKVMCGTLVAMIRGLRKPRR